MLIPNLNGYTTNSTAPRLNRFSKSRRFPDTKIVQNASSHLVRISEVPSIPFSNYFMMDLKNVAALADKQNSISNL
jgi:hypothetical protein